MRVLLPLKKAPASSNSSSESSDLQFTDDDSTTSSNSILSDQFPDGPTTTTTATKQVIPIAASLIPSNVEFERSVLPKVPPEHGSTEGEETGANSNDSLSRPSASLSCDSSSTQGLVAQAKHSCSVCAENNVRESSSLSRSDLATTEASSSLPFGASVASLSGIGTATVRARKRRAAFDNADIQLASGITNDSSCAINKKNGDSNNSNINSNSNSNKNNKSTNTNCDISSNSDSDSSSNNNGDGTCDNSKNIENKNKNYNKENAKDSNSSSNCTKKPRIKPPVTAATGEVESSKKPAAKGSLKPKSKPVATKLTGSMAGGRRKITDRRSGNNNRQSYYVDNRDAPNENDPASAHGDFTSIMGDHPNNRQHHNHHHHLDGDIELTFVHDLKKRGLEIVEQDGDGNCLFRSVSLQVYGDSNMHGEVRKRCLDFMARDEEHFSQFITDEPFQEYIGRKRLEGVHGNNPEIQAISELFNRPVEVFVPENGASPLNIFHSQYKTDDVPIRLSYHDGNHYNAVIDPLVPTAGLGLGLPGLKPGLADKLQIAKAKHESDILADQMEYKKALEESQNDELQRAIKESSFSVDNMYKNKAIALSDLDATNFELEQAMLESSLESFRNQEHGRKQSSSNSTARRRPWQQSGNGVASIPRSINNSEKGGGNSFVQPAAAAASSTTSSGPATSNVAASNYSSISAVARVNSADDVRPGEGVTVDEYPETVNELVMNGFELHKVVRAYELIGDNFDSLLAFLMSNTK